MFKMIVAMSRNRGIGFKNRLPWDLKQDLKFFKDNTIGNENNVVIMGKKTWYSIHHSISEPLPKRDKIIMTSSTDAVVFTPNCHIANNIENVIKICNENKYSERWIIGGEQVYKEFIKANVVQEIWVTEVDKYYNCDTFFPELPSHFNLIIKGQKIWEKGVPFRFTCYATNNCNQSSLHTHIS